MTDATSRAVPVEGWTPRPAPSQPSRHGRFVELERFDAATHTAGLHGAVGGRENAGLWEFIPFGPFDEAEALGALFDAINRSGEWLTYVFRAASGDDLLGTASLMGVRPEHGVAEVGCVVYSPALKRTSAATELQYLLAHHVFEDLGYRRYEWKCNARNAASRRAALRLGFSFEGIFRNHMVVRGENRDTAWFSMTDAEWPAIRAGFEAWLDPSNFDEQGVPRRSLAEARGPQAPA